MRCGRASARGNDGSACCVGVVVCCCCYKVLLDAGADWRVASNDGLTPLAAARAFRHSEAVQVLLAAGAEE